MESQRRTPPDNGRIGLVEGEAANGAAPAVPAAAVENEIKAFIGGLASWVTEEHLKEEFEKYGIVGANVTVKRYMGQSRGFGFVSFETEEGRQKAVERLHGKMFWGKEITVAPAKPGTGTPPAREEVGERNTLEAGAPIKDPTSILQANRKHRNEQEGAAHEGAGEADSRVAAEYSRVAADGPGAGGGAERELREKRILGVLQKEQQLAQVYELLEWARERGM